MGQVLSPRSYSVPSVGNKQRTKRVPKRNMLLKEPVILLNTKSILLIGPIGAGKTQNAKCLLGEVGGGQAGLVDGTTSLESSSFQYRHPETGVTFDIALHDIYGLTANEETDLKRLAAMQKSLTEKNAGTINQIFFCFKWERIIEGKLKIIEFVKNICSTSMHDIIHVIVTNAPSDYLDDEASMDEFKQNFSFLLKDQNDLETRFTFVNLTNPEDVADQQDIQERWEAHRNRLLDIIVSSDKACLVSDFKATTDIEDWVRLNRVKILLFSLGLLCLILAILYQFSKIDADNLKQEKENTEEILKVVNETAQHFQDRYKFWINVGDGVHSVSNKAKSAVNWATFGILFNSPNA